jgi:hypothetical protein
VLLRVEGEAYGDPLDPGATTSLGLDVSRTMATMATAVTPRPASGMARRFMVLSRGCMRPVIVTPAPS